MAFVSIRARPAFGRAGWMKGEQGFATRSLLPSTALRPRAFETGAIARDNNGLRAKCVARVPKHS
jgi:hypothetical protein